MLRFLWERAVQWGPAVFIVSVITFLSHQPKLPGPDGFAWEFLWFKTGHLVVYALLAWSLYRALWWQRWSQILSRRQVCILLATVAVLAVLDEVHQSFIPGRGPHIRDVGIDVLGAMLFVVWHRWSSQIISPEQ
ncbi:VanZ family protein [Candidatus Woesebacteria bacterium]|nr:VanZ family protein [Candidatus Woesebacteria bacterium]MCD8507601.1 VanZ family protein [Candidatus Woesebacteria bacterium]MCD8527445.1 VanZ family protein [Candidatus Woesebacteria bacterium]MCD8546187.1 VanZ family protein [Candidatus Woesebacteria bacterium]